MQPPGHGTLENIDKLEGAIPVECTEVYIDALENIDKLEGAIPYHTKKMDDQGLRILTN